VVTAVGGKVGEGRSPSPTRTGVARPGMARAARPRLPVAWCGHGPAADGALVVRRTHGRERRWCETAVRPRRWS
jgi:hypothetical protein